jgi:hypothetical protein
MSRSVTRLAGLAFAALLLASCSTVRLSYDHADWLLARALGHYADLDSSQARALRTGIGDLHAWHRNEELPKYAAMLDEAARRLERGLAAGDVDWMFRSVRERASALGARAGKDFAPVLASLDERQLHQIELRFDEENRKFVKTQMTGEPGSLLDKRAAWLCKQIEDFTGALTPAQQARIRQLVGAFPDMPRLRLDERMRRQQTLLRIAREGRASGQVAPALSHFLASPEAGRVDANQQAMERWDRAFATALLELEHTLTPQQRQSAVARFRAYAADFRELWEARGRNATAER